MIEYVKIIGNNKFEIELNRDDNLGSREEGREIIGDRNHK